MSVYIKGMEMPASCYLCPVNKDDGFGFFTCGVTHSECDFKNLPPNCPLVPVPPHGRLIDADDADSRYTPDFTELSDFQCGWNAAMKRVCEDAPTIIPAEEGE